MPVNSPQLNITLNDEERELLNKIESTHNSPPTVFVKGLLTAALEFYKTHGWFSFPIVILPEAFQARYVAEKQAEFGAVPTAGPMDAMVASTLIRKEPKEADSAPQVYPNRKGSSRAARR